MPNKNIARCSRPLCSSQSTDSHPTSPTARPQPGPEGHQLSGTTSMRPHQRMNHAPDHDHDHDHDQVRPVPSGPNSVPTTSPPPTTTFQTRRAGRTSSDTRGHRPNWSAFHPRAPPPTPAGTPRRGTDHGRRVALDRPRQGTTPPSWDHRDRPVLLRKEVIQPHLPVRLPCYDFVPIADPAFDGSLPQGVGPPASGVTDFRDVTGGVYKARERIHRSVADLRLLATPTSWGRVADPNPN
jgi:hypothetical protein